MGRQITLIDQRVMTTLDNPQQLKKLPEDMDAEEIEIEVSISGLVRAYGGSGEELTTEQAREWERLVGIKKGGVIHKKEELENYYSHDENDLERDIQLKIISDQCPDSSKKRIKFRSIINDGVCMRFLKTESIISQIFFRPKPSDYDHKYSNLVFIPMRHAEYKIPALWLPKERSRGVIIFTHGNACDISNSPVVTSYRNTFNMSVLAPEWPGYGLAAGVPTEESLPNTIMDVIIFLHEEMKFPISSIVLYSRSIATAPSILVAAELESQGMKLGGLILKSPYTSWKGILEFHARRFSILSRIVSCWMVERFNVEKAIENISLPVLILHGKRDEIIPYEHATRLYGRVNSDPDKKFLHLFDFACHDFGMDAWIETKTFLRSLDLTPKQYVTKLPPSCYELKKDAEFAIADRNRRRINVRCRRIFIIAIGIAVIGYAIALSVMFGELECSALAIAWLYLHGVTIISAAAIYLVSDWVQDHLVVASDPDVQKRAVIALIALLITWIVDVCLGHVVIFMDTSVCGYYHHWIGLMSCMGINYIYILQSVITNR